LRDFKVRKEVLCFSPDADQSEVTTVEVERIRRQRSNGPDIGYNRWPPLKIEPD
jgi:hypothetical protein